MCFYSMPIRLGSDRYKPRYKLAVIRIIGAYNKV